MGLPLLALRVGAPTGVIGDLPPELKVYLLTQLRGSNDVCGAVLNFCATHHIDECDDPNSPLWQWVHDTLQMPARPAGSTRKAYVLRLCNILQQPFDQHPPQEPTMQEWNWIFGQPTLSEEMKDYMSKRGFSLPMMETLAQNGHVLRARLPHRQWYDHVSPDPHIIVYTYQTNEADPGERTTIGIMEMSMENADYCYLKSRYNFYKMPGGGYQIRLTRRDNLDNGNVQSCTYRSEGSTEWNEFMKRWDEDGVEREKWKQELVKMKGEGDARATDFEIAKLSARRVWPAHWKTIRITKHRIAGSGKTEMTIGDFPYRAPPPVVQGGDNRHPENFRFWVKQNAYTDEFGPMKEYTTEFRTWGQRGVKRQTHANGHVRLFNDFNELYEIIGAPEDIFAGVEF